MIYDNKKSRLANILINTSGPKIQDIKKDRIIRIVKKFSDEFNSIQELKDNEYLEKRFRIIPTKYKTAKAFTKYGPEAKIICNITKKEAFEKQYTLTQTIKEKEHLLNRTVRALMYTYLYPKGMITVMTAQSWIEGAEWYALEGDKIKIQQHGNDFKIVMPSTSRPEKIYEFALRSLPSADHNWYNFKAGCNCEARMFSEMNQKYKGEEERICKHIVAAVHKVHHYLEENKLPPLKENPIPVPLEPIVKIKDILRNRSVIRLNGKPRRLLKKTEIDILLHNAIARYGLNNCFTFNEPVSNMEYAKKYLIKKVD